MSAVPAATIRAGRAQDLDSILALEAGFTSDRMSARSVRYFLTADSARVLVAEIRGLVAGVLILLLRRNSGWARIYSVAVDPRQRNLGLGRRLIEAAEQQARRDGRRGMSLEVRIDNAGARALYARLGYQEHATLRAYYEDGASGVRLRKPV
ncbi:MAG: GNAT family N-acetyltransferase [Pseudomonadota bacterium]|nr:GNAT family N-acetyltransferase [Pseudomonadota bacterium]